MDRLRRSHASLGAYHLYAEPSDELLFCDNEANAQRRYGVKAAGHFKDAFHEYIVHGNRGAVNPERRGTKAALHYVLKVAEGGMSQVRLRLSARSQAEPFADFADVAATRLREADEYYAALQQDLPNQDARLVQRQAFAGMIWSKQFYNYDIRTWLSVDPAQPPPPVARAHGRNSDWTHFNSCDIFSMPGQAVPHPADK